MVTGEVSSFCIRSEIPGEHGGSSGEDDVAVQITTDIEIALEDRVIAIEEI